MAPEFRDGGLDWVALLVATLLIALAPRLAQACSCGPYPPEFAPPALHANSSDVRVRDDEIEVRCEDRTLQQCHWEQRHSIFNEGRGAATITGSAGEGLTDPDVSYSVRLEGQYGQRPSFELDPTAIEVEIPGRSEVELVVRGDVSFTPWKCGCSASGIRRRHPLISRGPDPSLELIYRLYPGLPRADGMEAHFSFEYEGPGKIRARTTRSRTRHEGGRKRTSITVGRESHAYFSRKPPVVRGGPFAAIGGGWNTRRALRLRAGYEFAAPRWLVFAGAVETDTTDLRLVPTVSVMSGHSWFPILPGAALGVGAPIQVLPNARTGVRVQAELFWYVVSLVGALDVYPKRGGPALVGSLFAQLSF